jgi:hypothetical protein
VSNKGQKFNSVWDMEHGCGQLWPKLGCFLRANCFHCDFVDCLLHDDEAIAGKMRAERAKTWQKAIESGEFF